MIGSKGRKTTETYHKFNLFIFAEATKTYPKNSILFLLYLLEKVENRGIYSSDGDSISLEVSQT